MARLSRQTIVDAALELLDRVGLDALSTRRLADALDVRSPALYWHFKNKRELLNAMAEQMFEQAQMPPLPSPSDDPAEWLAQRQRAFRSALLTHRDGARVHAGSLPDPAQLPALVAQVDALTAAGMDTVAALRTILALGRYTVGWVLEEQATGERADADAFAELAEHPTLRGARTMFAHPDPDADFEFGLTALITGLLPPTRSRR